ncbi:MAG: alpha/beta fold hydrolase [Proteobacteria bacterium]|nr:alpha/beta fold hydrolase [Pseudomonadota bacterium]
MSTPWIRLSKTAEPGTKVFFFPYSGSGPQAYMPFAENSNFDLYALEMPGRGRRFTEKMHDSIHKIVEEACNHLVNLLDHRPFIFFGHSLGGILAFETTLELRRRGFESPGRLFVSGINPPHLPATVPPISHLPYDAFVERLRELGGTPHEILENAEMLSILVPILRNDFAVYENYIHQTKGSLSCPITALGGAHDHCCPSENLEKWSEKTEGPFLKHIFDGGHFFIYNHVKRIIGIMGEM